MEMNRGRIGVSSSTGHIHSLEDLADVNPERRPLEGDVLMFVDGRWQAMSLEHLFSVIRDTNS
jgi:hypothetical protein